MAREETDQHQVPTELHHTDQYFKQDLTLGATRAATRFEKRCIPDAAACAASFPAGEASMSSQRSRPPRGASSRQIANGNGEEIALWQNLMEELKHVSELEKKAEDLRVQIFKLEDEIKSKGSKPSVQEEMRLDNFYRQQVKIVDDINSMVKSGDDNIKHRLELLVALREAAERVPPPASRSANSRDGHRAPTETDGTVDSPSASPVIERARGRDRHGASGRNSVPREPSIKHESGEATPAADANPKNITKITYSVDDEVAFRPKPSPGNEDPDWIKGIVVRVIGDNKTRRYDVQDPEPDENSGAPGHIYRTSASSMVPIPPPGAPLADYSKGKTVLAQYPHTTTFYRAEVVGMSGSNVTLKFEGEDDAQSTQVVDRRFVLDHRGKVGQ